MLVMTWSVKPMSTQEESSSKTRVTEAVSHRLPVLPLSPSLSPLPPNTHPLVVVHCFNFHLQLNAIFCCVVLLV